MTRTIGFAARARAMESLRSVSIAVFATAFIAACGGGAGDHREHARLHLQVCGRKTRAGFGESGDQEILRESFV